eukprot:2858810-Prymnesium_polylepis.1
MALSRAITRSRRAMTRFRWGLPAVALEHRWLVAAECLADVVSAGDRFLDIFGRPAEGDERPCSMILAQRIQTAYAIAAESDTEAWGLSSPSFTRVICPQCGLHGAGDHCGYCGAPLDESKVAWRRAALALQAKQCTLCERRRESYRKLP